MLVPMQSEANDALDVEENEKWKDKLAEVGVALLKRICFRRSIDSCWLDLMQDMYSSVSCSFWTRPKGNIRQADQPNWDRAIQAKSHADTLIARGGSLQDAADAQTEASALLGVAVFSSIFSSKKDKEAKEEQTLTCKRNRNRKRKPHARRALSVSMPFMHTHAYAHLPARSRARARTRTHPHARAMRMTPER